MSLEQTGLFIAASFVLLMTPGPSVLYVMAQTLKGGWNASYYSVLGLACGDVLQVFVAAMGLSAFLAAFPAAGLLLQCFGALYLFYLAYSSLPEGRAGAYSSGDVAPARHYFRDAVIVNAFNPKTVLFFISFLPAFIQPTGLPVMAQIIILGGLFVTIGLGTNMFYAALCNFGILRFQILQSRYLQNWVPAIVLVALGVGVLFV